MGKKSKDPPNPKHDSVSGRDSSSVFSKLFGHTPAPEGDAPAPEGDAPASLFSVDNPFRRKHVDTPSQSTKESELESADRNPKENSTDNPNVSGIELSKKDKKKKKNKRGKEEIEAVEEEKSSEDALVSKKSKSESELNGETNPSVEKKKEKKKRKRDELEKEYEEKKYGAKDDDEELKENLVGRKRKSVENPAEMKVSKEGYDDETKLLRTIFVGNLPLKTKKKALLKEFCQFGEVESVRIRSVPTLDGKQPKKVRIMNNKINDAVDSVNGYIVFKTEQSAEASLAHNMAVVGGNHIRVDRACPPRKKLKGEGTPLYDAKRTVFVGNLPFDVKDEEVYQLFCGLNQVGSSVEAVRVIRDSHTSLGKGIAYVLFKTREAANLTVKRRSLKLRDRELRISHAKSNSSSNFNSNSTPAKRKIESIDGSGDSSGKKRQFEPKTPDSGFKPRMNASASYEGVRASKSGKETKKPYRKVTKTVVFKRPESKGKEEPKQRSSKRPSVAARKAKANAAMKTGGGSGSNVAGKKRKAGSRTPQSSNKTNKRAKKSK